MLGAATGFQLFPGVPVSALMLLCPVTAAVIFVYRENRAEGVAELLKRSFDSRRIRNKIWYAPILLLMPGVAVLSYGVMRWMGVPLQPPPLAVFATLGLLLVSFVAALGEELGWSGFIIDPMQDRWGAFLSSIVLGVVWAAWHIVPLLQVHRSPAWIAWWCLGTVAQRVLIVWLYNNTGRSVFAATVFHAMCNVSWQSFPVHGSHWDPRVTGLITALAAVFVTIVWGPRTLVRNRETPVIEVD